MLPKANRLKKTRDIERVFKNGKSQKEGFLLLKFVKNGLNVSRFAFVVGQKISKKAVVRNRIKRRIRDAAKKEILEVRPGFDGAWLALRNPETEEIKSIKSIVKKLLKKSGICS